MQFAILRQVSIFTALDSVDLGAEPETPGVFHAMHSLSIFLHTFYPSYSVLKVRWPQAPHTRGWSCKMNNGPFGNDTECMQVKDRWVFYPSKDLLLVYLLR